MRQAGILVCVGFGHAVPQGNAVRNDPRSPYKCTFCSVPLIRQPLSGWGKWMTVLPVRQFQCPHCFDTYLRPIERLGAFPVIQRMFRRRDKETATLNSLCAAHRKSLSSREGIWTRMMRMAARLGDQVSASEDFLYVQCRRIIKRMSGLIQRRRSEPRKPQRDRNRHTEMRSE